MKHARLSASAASRWMACAGSVPLCEERGLTGDASYEAATGTYAHHIAAACLLEPIPRGGTATGQQVLPKGAAAWLGNKTIVDGHVVECNQEMVDGVQFYLDEIAADLMFGDKTWVEADITTALAKHHPDLGGNSDYIRWRPSTRELRVWDFKYGEGVFVSPEENEQLMTYALGALLTSGVRAKKITVTICQPRIENEEGLTRNWCLSTARVLAFAADLIEAARAVKPGAPLVAGKEQCRFCPARRVCPELEKAQHAVVAMQFTPATVYNPAQLAEALKLVPLVKARLKALDEFAYEEAMSGRFGPEHGYKLVDKRATRKVSDEAGAKAWAAVRGVDPYEPQTLKSPAQLEKGLRKADKDALAPFIESKSSGLTLVPIADDRPEAKRLTAEAFEATVVPSTPTSLGF